MNVELVFFVCSPFFVRIESFVQIVSSVERALNWSAPCLSKVVVVVVVALVVANPPSLRRTRLSCEAPFLLFFFRRKIYALPAPASTLSLLLELVTLVDVAQRALA